MSNTRHVKPGQTRPAVKPSRSIAVRPATTVRVDGSAKIALSSDESPSQSAARMLGDVAQDIRGPLAAARESIRMVRDGHAGDISEQQRSLLSGAMDQCEVIDFVATELNRSDLQTANAAPVHRRWVNTSEVVESIVQATAAIQNVRRIGLRVDNVVRQPTEIFVDPAAIVRLVTNLVLCATRVSQSGQNVCLRLETMQHGSEVRWLVIDQGPGISHSRLHRLTQRGVSMSGSAGLSWTIARRLATATQSTLTIQSQLGRGTTVSFTTPAGSAAAVAASYARWRLAIRSAGMKPSRRGETDQSQTVDATASKLTTDAPSDLIELGPEWHRPRSESQAMVGTLLVGALVPRRTSELLERELRQASTNFDLFYKIDASRYVYCLDTNPRRFRERIETLNSNIARHLIDIRLQWSEPTTMSIDRHRWVAKLSDLLVRQSLSGVASPSVIDRDDVRPGTETIAQSPAVTSRLDAEIRHLGQRLNRQTAIMRDQVAKLRRLP